jgi:AraC family transcriptional regulator of adaptative response/methylated-DNA-[protein]-cysteine methyltransferase
MNVKPENRYDLPVSLGDMLIPVIGASNKEAGNKKVITISRIDTPLGAMIACASDDGVCLLEFADRGSLPAELKQISALLDSVIRLGRHDLIDTLSIQLDEYFSGARKQFDIPLLATGTEFQKSVWKMLESIPYGETRSYKQQAELLGKPEAIRAVASANGSNRIAILIPCHRVIGGDGSLTGYAGGLWRKRWLLDLESGSKELSLF